MVLPVICIHASRALNSANKNTQSEACGRASLFANTDPQTTALQVRWLRQQADRKIFWYKWSTLNVFLELNFSYILFEKEAKLIG